MTSVSNSSIAFILYDYPIGVSSMIINSINLFVEKGYSVDIYTNERNFSRSPIELPHVRIFRFDDKHKSILFKLWRYVFWLSGNLLLPVIRWMTTEYCLLLFFNDIYHFSRWLIKRILNQTYLFIVPVEYFSLICCDHVPEKNRIVYYNMELLDWGHQNTPVTKNKLIVKTLEFREIQKISHAVIPSPLRKDIFAKINAFNKKSCYILPVASTGPAVAIKSKYFRNLFHIYDSDRIVIYSGNFKPWAKCLEIIQSVSSWPKGYILVMHTWSDSAVQSSYFEEMRKQATDLPIYFSTEFIDYNELASALSSADIGLAFYDEIDDNFTEILFSSNKIAEYLKAGLPIICSDFPSLKKFVDTHHIGMAVAVEGIAKGIRAIGNNLDSYRKNALNCYEKSYRFDFFFESFLNDITLNIQ